MFMIGSSYMPTANTTASVCVCVGETEKLVKTFSIAMNEWKRKAKEGKNVKES